MTWHELENEIKVLRSKIKYSPDIIVGVVRGGLIPARLLSSYLNVKEMYCLTVKKVSDQRKVKTVIEENIDGKSVLLVEDMLETGKSLVVAKQYLESKGAVVKTACLYTMPKSEVVPDYFLEEIHRVVKFPWE